MSKTKIKICGIKDAELAYLTAQEGADFIGLIFVPSSHRAVNMQIAKDIAHATLEGGAIPVAVFAEASANSMLNICTATNIQWVQLHGEQARAEQHLLPDHLHRIYASHVSSQGIANIDDAIKQLDRKRDYLLFDSEKGGSGKTFSWEKFSYNGDFPWFLSGGLNANNVKTAIEKLHPTVVDVSSGVENFKGEKTLGLIKQFIKSCRLD